MKAKEYLSKLKLINKRIKLYEDELSEKESLYGSVSSSNFYQGSVCNRKNAHFTVIVERMDSLKEMICQERQKKDYILDQIRSLENPTYIDVLSKVYEKGESLKQISYEIGYCYEYTRKLHSLALADFQKKFLKK